MQMLHFMNSVGTWWFICGLEVLLENAKFFLWSSTFGKEVIEYFMVCLDLKRLL